MDALDKLIERYITADERLKGVIARVAEAELRMRQAKLRADTLEDTLRSVRAQFAIEDLRAERETETAIGPDEDAARATEAVLESNKSSRAGEL